MSEIDIAIRYGLIEQEKADELPAEESSHGLTVRVFDEGEDSQWRTGILMARAKAGKTPLRITRHAAAAEGLDRTAAQARREGKVPFRVAGPRDIVPGFLHMAGISEAELIS